MAEHREHVALMLQGYRDLIERFISGEISADVFERDYMKHFKSDPNQIVGDEFDVLDRLFADIDEYVDDPVIRQDTGGISGEELRERAQAAYDRLYGEAR
ncbi:colicin immunity domain-containing protein [Mycolicibacterium arenosum]|uniref:Colicin immunity domain-containing protein n=1 Tax=Mycolicibacterium arenosum TaxID=2952157 RepID=A0ABT1M629_9MYCO|nr:colicin immunity domain-containing protein [Mycolicibacterium sp. CAU 1645]MCP9274035.1 colicin immunity domain-containing protein [Mycolicibacterium sp. CAU 1645]